MASTTPEAPPRAGLTILALCLAVFIVPYGLSSAPVALPAMGRDLDAGVVPLQWVVNAYNVTAASFMMAAGSIADRIGRKRVFGFGIVLYGVSALTGALATNVIMVDIARAVAGVAAAAMMTAGVSVMANMFHGAARTKAFAYVGVTIGAGLALGPTTSGMLVSAMGWQSIFWVQFAIAAVSVAGLRLVQESKDPDAKAVDWAGTATFTLALFCFTLGVIQGPTWGWGSSGVLGLFAGCLVLLAAFVAVERRQQHPMFDLSLFTEPRFMAVNLLATAVSFGFVGLMVLLPSYLVGANGLTDSQAGITMLLLTAPVLLFPLVAGRLVQAGVSMRPILSGSLVLVAAGLAWLTVVHPGVSLLELAGPLLLVGIGIGLIYGLMDGAAVSTVSPAKVGMASGMFNTIRLASEAVAVAGMVAALVSLVQGKLSDGIGRFAQGSGLDAKQATDSVTSGNLDTVVAKTPAGGREALTDFLGQGYTQGFQVVLWATAAICLASAIVLHLILKDRSEDPAAPAEDNNAPQPTKAHADATV
ncbi:MFS transporter [Streptomyces albus]|uniref:MFS transporter n=1 Tax=Streptomyces albus TaxID=1888 RepID=A0A8H1QTH7_9ACTN|nr:MULTISPECIES: MFS transporter [Streptomyces]TGG86523.1 MFS transporter [Streptomyces albus]UVN53117.1 MFS transporter [Streptomyces albus]GHJ19057.1 MFS transporter [Streptomyces albus]